MDIQVNEISPGGPLKVSLQGRLDAAGSDRIETKFNAAVVAGGREAIVDLADVSLITSMGIRMLIIAARAMGQRKCRLVLFGAQPLVLEVLETAALDTLIAVVPDEAAAVALLAS